MGKRTLQLSQATQCYFSLDTVEAVAVGTLFSDGLWLVVVNRGRSSPAFLPNLEREWTELLWGWISWYSRIQNLSSDSQIFLQPVCWKSSLRTWICLIISPLEWRLHSSENYSCWGKWPKCNTVRTLVFLQFKYKDSTFSFSFFGIQHIDHMHSACYLA